MHCNLNGHFRLSTKDNMSGADVHVHRNLEGQRQSVLLRYLKKYSCDRSLKFELVLINFTNMVIFVMKFW